MAAGVYQSVFVLLVVCVGAARGKIVDLSVDRSTHGHIVFYLCIYYLCLHLHTVAMVHVNWSRFRSARGRACRLVAGRGPVQHSLHWHKSTAEPLLKLGLS